MDILGTDRVRMVAEVAGRREEGDTVLTADPAARRLEWRGSRSNGYRGWLTVTPEGSGHALVTIHLSTETHDGAVEIEDVLVKTLSNVRERTSIGSAA
jgi:hypothetical protein